MPFFNIDDQMSIPPTKATIRKYLLIAIYKPEPLLIGE
jgi:hypothetical protein